MQKRAQERREQILTITAQLLEEVGQDDLTTILVAKTVRHVCGDPLSLFPKQVCDSLCIGRAVARRDGCGPTKVGRLSNRNP